MSSNVWKQAAVVLVAFAAGAVAMNFATVHAAAFATTPAAQFDSDSQCAAQVPRAWGEFKGGSSQSGLAFQAPDGTLRFDMPQPPGIHLSVRTRPGIEPAIASAVVQAMRATLSHEPAADALLAV